MTAYTEDDVELATKILRESDPGASSWWCEEDARAVLDAVAPAIAGRALREAADAMLNEKGVTFADVLMVAWLRARAEQVNP